MLTLQGPRVKHDQDTRQTRLFIAVSDPQRSPDVLSFARHADRNWVILYRHFGAPDRGEMAQQLAHACKLTGAALWLSVTDAEDLALAIRVNAAGVHIPERVRASLLKALRRVPEGLRRSTSAHSAKAVQSARCVGFDYAIVSAAFPSASASAGPPLGMARLASYARLWPGHVIALGGINEHTFRRALGVPELAGVASVAGQINLRNRLRHAPRLSG